MVLLRVLASSFESLAQHHEIALECEIPDGDEQVWLETDAIEKIVGNLLSNAVKYTPAGGTVTIRARMDEEVRELPVPRSESVRAHADDNQACAPGRILVVEVLNTGAYLSPDVRAMVFERFYRASRIGGSGVGLALVRELTEWLGGRVMVESWPEHGTCFTVELPTFLVHPEFMPELPDPLDTPRPPDLSSVTLDRDAGVLADAGLAATRRVLVVEDHAEMREFICKDLAAEYHILEAEAGDQGLEVAIAEIPDLVVSDVMMPGLDGFELCRRLKEDARTSHVPVILLTALSETESKHRGLRDGADDYLAKPFNADELKLRIRNLIEQRRSLAERYASLDRPDLDTESADDRFVNHVREVIDAHLDDPEFRISGLCREVAMSRSQLHRKLKAVTGRTTSDFVRTHRLRKATQLLEAGYGNVTEVAYAVGFQSLSYFSRSFRDLYGFQPSEYLRKRRES
jgi:DNA-binding response OmpR family regulator/two-component sensor histidine kinase